MIVVIVTAVLLCCYAALIHTYRIWYRRLKPFVIPDIEPATSFSIIIPARNEETSISNCVLSIINNHYPSDLFEVIVIDDHSTDRTPVIVEEISKKYSNVKLIRLAEELDGTSLNSYKKKAIEIAISYSTKDWIVTTDADCRVTPRWLKGYDAYIQQNDPVFVAAPVMFVTDGSFVTMFQCLDFISLQGITAASVSAGFHSMCNGANLGYRKDVFYEVNGFKGIDNIASGDDMLLMHKMNMHYSDRIGYLFAREAVVLTDPMPDWKSFFNQRIRWASKAEAYDDKRIIFVLLFVYTLNFLLLFLPVLALWNPYILLYWLGLVILKTFSEYTFMFFVASFFRLKPLLRWFPFMQPVHIFYTVIAGFFGKFGKYQWKGRTVK
ncbi:glycosyltransferase [Danxiaibacter flavus]|uniref:Glycosyltransferase n=1 Tax=Danxiaibacter flavus TaxID=3049108 RepID=A0ABV3ZML4_9BACT|nr:glycosyltransferase [Chitinophagaceae bacterium DXS]